MSNIYIQEPPTYGKVLLKTTAGDIDVELWSKEAPKASRNFVQLCMEGYYNGTVFHRVVKDFIVQGGDPTGSGEGGESIYGHPFKDEFHSRLRFCRRGLLAMANAGKDDNASQFFFTMGPCQELQNKHTIFGKVSGDTVYNMLKLQEGLVDQNERPQFPQKIIKTTVLNNPFPDIIPRTESSSTDSTKEGKRKRDKKTGVKDFKLLSFGEEAEEDEEETARENKKFSGRSKSTHDLLDDPRLSAMPAVPEARSADSDSSELSDDCGENNKQESSQVDELDLVKKKLSVQKSQPKTRAPVEQDDDDIEGYSLGQDRREERQKKTEAIKEEYRKMRREMRRKDDEAEVKPAESSSEKEPSQIMQDYQKEREEYEEQKKKLPAKGSDRESFTLALLAKFQKKLENVKEEASHEDVEKVAEPQVTEEYDEADLGQDGGKWMSGKLQFDGNVPVLARDANTKDTNPEDWFSIEDPRNPINRRRRDADKASTSKKKN